MRASKLCSSYILHLYWTALVMQRNPEIARHILIFERFLCMRTNRAENRWKFAALTCPDFRCFFSPPTIFPYLRARTSGSSEWYCDPVFFHFFIFIFSLLLCTGFVRKVTSFFCAARMKRFVVKFMRESFRFYTIWIFKFFFCVICSNGGFAEKAGVGFRLRVMLYYHKLAPTNVFLFWCYQCGANNLNVSNKF